MSEPFIHIGTYSVKEGKLEDFKRYVREFCQFVEAKEPRLIHFGFYFSEDGAEVSVVQVHPDPASMAHHMQVISDHLTAAYDFLDAVKSVQNYGAPGATLLEQIKNASGPGVPVTAKADYLGFSRLLAAAV